MNEKEELLNKINELYEEAKYQQILDLLTDDVLEKANDSELFSWQEMAINQIQTNIKKESILLANNYYESGCKYFNNNDFKSAILDFEKALEINSEYFDALFHTGLAYAQMQKYSEAIVYFNKSIELNTHESSLYYNRGTALAKNGEYQKAIDDFTKTILLNNEDYEAYYNRALCFENLENYNEAINDYNQAIELNDRDAKIYYGRGVSYGKMGDDHKAILDLDKAIEIEPNYLNAYVDIGIAYNRIKNHIKAIDYLNIAIKLDNTNPELYYIMGSVWASCDNFKKVIECFNKAIVLKPDYFEVFFDRGLVFSQLDDFERAIADFTKAIEIRSELPELFYIRGLTYAFAMQYEKAISDYSVALSMNGKFSFLKNDIKEIEEKIQLKKIIYESGVSENFIDKKIKIELEIKRIISEIKSISKFEGEYVVHYTKMTLAEIFVKNTDSKINYSNVIYMNDPLEGKLFFKYLNDDKIKESFDNAKSRSETSVYLGSFLPVDDSGNERSHEDDLVMWRTYGKDENGREASGCSIVIDTNFFQTVTESKKATNSNNKILPRIQVSSFPEDERLMTMIYLKKNKDGFEIEGQFKNKIENEIKELKEQLKLLLELIDGSFPVSKVFKESIEDMIFQELSELSYLFKSSDYSFENEVRIIKHMSLDSDLIRCREINFSNTPNKILYIESNNNILPYIRKIYIGPKVAQKEKWSLYLDYEIRQRNKEMKKHESNISENIATSVEAKQDKLDIKIIKSKCEFQ